MNLEFINGVRHVRMDVDVMTHYGDKFYTTVQILIPLNPQVIDGTLVWDYDDELLKEMVMKNVSSLKNRKDVRLFIQ